MLFKPILVFAFVWLTVPSAIDMGPGTRPPPSTNTELKHARVIVLDALNRVRADLRDNGRGTKVL
jgi:hypothetical protein